jgi:hypothetical protein
MDETFDFGEALKRLKLGGTVARHGWKGMWVRLIKDPALPFLYMWTGQGQTAVPWLASQTDLLAEDWATVGE